jgi:hypothetical protein
MDVISLSEDLKSVKGVYDFFKATISHRLDEGTQETFDTYIVGIEDEMRIDLILQNMYGLDSFNVKLYMQDIDIICAINNIDNPLNIKSGMVLRYPSLGLLKDYRIRSETDLNSKKKSAISQLGVPNKQTKIDSSRKRYQDNGYALPPTVNKNPKSPVTIENGMYKIGGL